MGCERVGECLLLLEVRIYSDVTLLLIIIVGSQVRVLVQKLMSTLKDMFLIVTLLALVIDVAGRYGS